MTRGYKKRIVINHEIKPINPVQCGMHNCPASYSFGPCIRKYYILHFVINGKGTFTNETQTYELHENQIFIIHPEETVYYEADPIEPWSYIWISFTSDIELPSALVNNAILDAPELRRFFCSAFDNSDFEQKDTSGAYEYYLSGIIWQILGYLKRVQGAVYTGDDYLKIAISLMKSENRLKIHRVAALTHISKMHLTRLFNEKYGMSPGKFYFNMQMSQASEMLLSGKSIKHTASIIGFTDIFSFSRAFKRHYGYSPSEYVKIHSKSKLQE